MTVNTDIRTPEELDREVAEFTNAIQKGYEASTYLIKLKKRNDEIGDHAKQLISLRNKARRLWQRTRDTRHKKHMYELAKHIRVVIQSDRNKKWRDKLQKKYNQVTTRYLN